MMNERMFKVGWQRNGRQAYRCVTATVADLLWLLQLLLLLHLVVNVAGQLFNQTQCLPSFVAHQTNRAVVHHLVQLYQILRSCQIVADEVVGQVGVQLGPLLSDFVKIDEKA